MPPRDTQTAIRLGGVRVKFDKTELHFDCTIRKGEIVAITGASGSGKSTLLNIVAGFETPDAGVVEILGENVASRDPADRPVSVIFQEHNLFSHLDVATNIALGIDPALRLGVKERGKVASALMRVGLEGFGKRLPPTLSGGERQRVALARALVRRKPVLLLDEPFAALDPGLRSGMTRLLLDLHAQEGNTMLVVTHHPDDVRALADSVIFLDEGRVLLHQPKAQFLNHTDSPVVARFLGK
ncbi:ATP-binding cassette domain-containing protein [Rhizobium herbae]|uniref:ATP-binding cassette domain-containing protein n=1 Tax=Rhizobium herbae TaxID=508661 RepID=A0ABS7HHK3_9HYPH|nr:ATP-binding cassette domain-containing protein [Rhizobium herbae]MBW9065728.1 ATP-binding cassette domain-containing protein [Rhizobium herbae]